MLRSSVVLCGVLGVHAGMKLGLYGAVWWCRETRSLKACYELMKAGWKDVIHLEGGLSEWRHKRYPIESS